MRIKKASISELSVNIFDFKWTEVFHRCLDMGVNPLLIFDTLGRKNNGFEILYSIERHIGQAIKVVPNVQK